MAELKLAAVFRHRPEEDGEFTIPASISRPDPLRDWDVVVDPIVGFMAVSYRSRISWSFIKYEAPEIHLLKNREPSRKLARFSTTRVGHVSCPACGNSCVYPIWGSPEKTRCPACGHQGQDICPIKETDPEFFEMLGDLRQPLEDAVTRPDAGAEEFHFPRLLMVSRYLQPSPNVSAQIQGAAQALGLAVKPAGESYLDELFSDDYMPEEESSGLVIEPGITVGTLDPDKVREGWTKVQGVVNQTVRLPWLAKTPPRPKRFGGVRF